MRRPHQRFDPERGYSFAAFAIPTILGELRRFCRDTTWAVHVPRGVQERALAVRAAGDCFSATYGRTPTVAELAEAVGSPVEDVIEALVAASNRSAVSLDAELEDAEDARPPSEQVGEIDPGFELVECLTTLEASMSALTISERRALRLRFGEDLALQQIAERLDVPPSHVSRLLDSGIAALRPAVESGPASPRRHCSQRRPRPHSAGRQQARSLEVAA